ncbi:unnamed protein product [Brassica oleracea]
MKILLLNLQTKHKLKSWALYLMRRYSSPSTQTAGKHSEDDGTISIDQLPHRHLSREHSEKREHERDFMDDNDHYKSRDRDRRRSFDREREERHRPGSRSRSSSRS